jgi:hypothetical protein
VDLKVPVTISDELFDDVVASKALLNLASGEISHVEYQNYDLDAKGLPWEHEDYDFSCGMLSNNGKDVEFTVQYALFSSLCEFFSHLEQRVQASKSGQLDGCAF